MFVYCNNNSVSNYDPSGYACIAAFQTTRDGFFKEGGSAGLSGSALAILLRNVALAGAALITTIVASKPKTQEKENARVITQAKSDAEQYQYWEAARLSNTVVTGRGLSLTEASLRVAGGGDILCANQGAAISILIVNRYWSAVGPEIHGESGYFWHYHPNRHSHTHIWYLI